MQLPATLFVRVNTGATENTGMENARRSKSDGGKPESTETDTHYIGIVIPGSRIEDSGRFYQSRIPGLAKPKSRDFGIEKICICQLKTADIP